jgi:uncharacterized coiled-coil protein SlyX
MIEDRIKMLEDMAHRDFQIEQLNAELYGLRHKIERIVDFLKWIETSLSSTDEYFKSYKVQKTVDECRSLIRLLRYD